MNIYLYNYTSTEIKWIGLVDDFISLDFECLYSGIGSFELVMPPDSPNLSRVYAANIIWYSPTRAGLIISVVRELRDHQTTITVKGVELKGLASQRLVYPPAGQEFQKLEDATHEAIMAAIITAQIIAPTASERAINGILDVYTVPSDAETATLEGRYETAAELLEDHATDGNAGWRATIIDGVIHWQIYHGVDRSTTSQHPLILSLELDSFSEFMIEDQRLPNLALIAGAGSGASRIIETLGDSTGFDRWECYAEAGDKNEETDLPSVGKTALADYGDRLVIEAVLAPHLQESFGNAFDVGDIVTLQGILHEQDIDMRITAATEVYDEDGRRIELEFGYAKSTFTDSIRRTNRVTKSLIKR
ncbi:MAG: hypothetical protein PHT58_07195 [Eubacteriales bacterium]|nr:hypothetical protein [Eubacteriales bacterium]